jgi:transposase
VHLRLVAVILRQSRLATQEGICQAFGCGVSTQARWEREYGQRGIDGLVSKKSTGCGRELDRSREGVVRRWFRAGQSNRRMGGRLGVDEATIRRALKRLGLTRTAAAPEPFLPGIEETALPPASTTVAESVHLGPRSARPQWRSVPGLRGAVGRWGAVVCRRGVRAVCRCAVRRSAVGPPRVAGGVRLGLSLPEEEGRTLLHAAFQSPARLEVTDQEVRMTIAAQSSPHRTTALSALCAQLDDVAVLFPGTQLRLRLAVQAPEPVTS